MTYDQLPIFSKVLYYVNNQHVSPWQKPWVAFEGMVKAVAREVPGMSVEGEGSRLTVRLGAQEWKAEKAEVDTPWTMRGKLQGLFAWLAPQLTLKDGLSIDQQLARLEVLAANGLLSAIDAHSVLFPPAQSREYLEQKPQKAGSIGLFVRQLDARICVESAIADGPAARAGISAGSILEKIDETPVVGMSLEDVVERLRGPVGTSVRLTLSHGSHSKALSIGVERKQVPNPPMSPPAQILKGEDPLTRRIVSIGYCRLRNFASSAEASLENALVRFSLEGVKGIILDLRGNPGGLFDQATKVADAFLDSGVISTLVGRKKDQRSEAMAHVGGQATTVPLVVLVDAKSASASEIVAAALQQHDRALVLGEKTYGNGSVQMLFSFSAPVPLSVKDTDTQMYLKLTTAHFLAPHDQAIEGVGVTPDVWLCPEDGAPSPSCPAEGPVVAYMVPPTEQGECGPVLLKPEQEFPVQLARDFLVRARSASAKRMLLDGKDLLKAAAKEHVGGQPRR
jgi:carboxyl-terminal processing protease